MDKFVRAKFPDNEKVSLLVQSQEGSFNTYADALAKLEFHKIPQTRFYRINNKMTWLGKSVAFVQGGGTDFSGISVSYMDIEGLVNFPALMHELKTHCGLQASALAGRMSKIESWNWRDNQVALIVNMLRYIWLKEIEVSQGGHLNGTLPTYSDGHVDADRNQYFDEKYPELCGGLEWPGTEDIESYPVPHYMSDYLTEDERDMLAMNTLTSSEIVFVIAMLGKWKRKSRFILDFDTPMLTKHAHYRATGQVAELEAWIRPDESVPCEPTGIETAKTALKKYICENRLYHQYAAALQLLCQVAVQYVPDTLEGTAWLTYERKIMIPAFSASRGRYTPLLAGDAGLLAARDLADFSYYGCELSVAKPAMCMMAEGYQTGVAVRASRVRNEAECTDIHLSKSVIGQSSAHWTSLVAEGLRSPVPIIQMSDCYSIINDLPLDEATGSAVVEVEQEKQPGYLIVKEGERNIVRVPYMVAPGVQIMAAPTEPFPEQSPYSLNITLKIPEERKNRFGASLTMMEAWKYAWIMRICGYDTDVARPKEFSLQQRFFAANSNRWTHCLQKLRDDMFVNVSVKGVKSRDDPHRLSIPKIHEEGINHEITFQLMYVERGCSRTDQVGHQPISSSAGYYTTGDFDKARLVTEKSFERLKAYVLREPSGFRFVASVEAALIPQSTVETLVAPVEPIQTGGTETGEM